VDVDCLLTASAIEAFAGSMLLVGVFCAVEEEEDESWRDGWCLIPHGADETAR
jgi:hypothetical protein